MFISHLYFLSHELTSLLLKGRKNLQGLARGKRLPDHYRQALGPGVAGEKIKSLPGLPGNYLVGFFPNQRTAFYTVSLQSVFVLYLFVCWEIFWICERRYLHSIQTRACNSFPTSLPVPFGFLLWESHWFTVPCCRSCLSLLRSVPSSQELWLLCNLLRFKSVAHVVLIVLHSSRAHPYWCLNIILFSLDL